MKKVDSYIRISEIIYNYLHGDITQEEQEMLDCWLKDEKHKKFFLELKNTGRLYEDLQDMQYMEVDKAFDNIQSRMVQKKQSRWWQWMSGVAAVLAIGMGTWLWYGSGANRQTEQTTVAMRMPEGDWNVLKTAAGGVVVLPDTVGTVNAAQMHRPLQPTGQQLAPDTQAPEIHYNVLTTSSRGNISVTLYDSTRVWLNAGSELRYPEQFAGNVREVYVRGEAYFEVAKDVHKPFVVKTEAGQVEVLGTHFNVKAPARGPWVTTLVEGCVKIRNAKNDSVIIFPGQQVVAHSLGNMHVMSVDTRYCTAWKKNLFAFQEETLYHIMTVLSEWYEFPFDIESMELANMRFTTMIEKFPGVDDVLEILQRTEKFTFVHNQDGLVLIRE